VQGQTQRRLRRREAKIDLSQQPVMFVQHLGDRNREGDHRDKNCFPAPVRALGEEIHVPKLIGMHTVVDVNKWLSFKADRAGAIGSMGGSNVVDYVAHDGSNVVAISADVDDVEAMLASMASPPPEVQAAMQEHGVIPPLTFYVEK
jgi:hypothetical protein